MRGNPVITLATGPRIVDIRRFATAMARCVALLMPPDHVLA